MLRNPANEQVIGAGTGRPKADVYYYAPAGKKLVRETSADYKRVPALKMYTRNCKGFLLNVMPKNDILTDLPSLRVAYFAPHAGMLHVVNVSKDIMR